MERKESGKTKGEGGRRKNKGGKRKGDRDGKESLGGEGGEGKGVGKRGGEGRENLGGPGPPKRFFPRTAPVRRPVVTDGGYM